ncbi:Uncharacterized protein HZ326_5298 [Fusarium oxysporum f. sp. albedinis]|nr:Uncharacterized protein HZ326_5298 [Fusarium oxysporum f. sp. albedinis]
MRIWTPSYCGAACSACVGYGQGYASELTPFWLTSRSFLIWDRPGTGPGCRHCSKQALSVSAPDGTDDHISPIGPSLREAKERRASVHTEKDDDSSANTSSRRRTISDPTTVDPLGMWATAGLRVDPVGIPAGSQLLA